MLVSARVDELAGHAHPVAGAAHAALEHVGDAEFLRDLFDGFRRAAVLHDGGARDDVQFADEGEVGQDILVDAVGKERALLALAQVLEWEHGHGFRVRLQRCET